MDEPARVVLSHNIVGVFAKQKAKCEGIAKAVKVLLNAVDIKCIVAIGMIGCKRNKRDFLRGYNYMLERIEPDAIICLGDPFNEMDGNLVVLDYQKSRKAVR